MENRPEMSHLCRNRNIHPTVNRRAHELRAAQTYAEDLLWEQVRRKQLGVRFRRQHVIGHLIVDFYCPSLMLAIETDGAIHLTPQVVERDHYKTELLEGQGIRLMRFTNEEIIHNMDEVIRQIREVIAQSQGW